jgi:hypothetical protein
VADEVKRAVRIAALAVLGFSIQAAVGVTTTDAVGVKNPVDSLGNLPSGWKTYGLVALGVFILLTTGSTVFRRSPMMGRSSTGRRDHAGDCPSCGNSVVVAPVPRFRWTGGKTREARCVNCGWHN